MALPKSMLEIRAVVKWRMIGSGSSFDHYRVNVSYKQDRTLRFATLKCTRTPAIAYLLLERCRVSGAGSRSGDVMRYRAAIGPTRGRMGRANLPGARVIDRGDCATLKMSLIMRAHGGPNESVFRMERGKPGMLRWRNALDRLRRVAITLVSRGSATP